MRAAAKMILAILWGAAPLVNGAPAADARCMHWRNPDLNSRNAFYKAGPYGQIGVKYGHTSALIVAQNGCYDFSKRVRDLSELEFLFNNKVDQDAGSNRPTYLGVLAIRTYKYKMTSPKPIIVAFYRNGNSLDSSSDWVMASDAERGVRHGDVVDWSNLRKQVDPYEPSDDVNVAKLSDIPTLLKNYVTLADVATRDLIKRWYALVVTNDDAAPGKAIVERNAERLDDAWEPDERIVAIPATGTTISRHYLIKYVDSANPSQDVFFKVQGIRGAQCLYLKLIDPRSRGPLLGLSDQSGEFVVIKLRRTAGC